MIDLKDFELSTLLNKKSSHLCILFHSLSFSLFLFFSLSLSVIMLTNRPTVWRVLSETSHIISSHSLHFLTLSLLFIFPTSLAAIIYSFLLQPTSLHSNHLRFHSDVSNSDIPPVGKSALLIQLLYFLSIFLFNLCAIPSITYSVFHAYYGTPVKLISSLKSIFVSFFPLFATTLVVEVIMGLIVFVFIILMLLSYNALAFLGFEMDYDDQSFLVFVILIATLLVGVLVYLQVGWYLMYAVVVLESKWGFAPLKRSWYLVKGVRGVIFLTILLFGILSGILSIWFLRVVANAEGLSGWLVVQMVVFAGFSTALSLYGLAANTVLFAYCKALHCEPAFRIDDEFGVEYVRLPSDVVNVV